MKRLHVWAGLAGAGACVAVASKCGLRTTAKRSYNHLQQHHQARQAPDPRFGTEPCGITEPFENMIKMFKEMFKV